MQLFIRLVVLLTLFHVGPLHAWQIGEADIVMIQDREWAQPDLFTNGIAWNEFAALCPGGVCAGTLSSGIDLDGWTWASLNDLFDLGNHYLGPGTLDAVNFGTFVDSHYQLNAMFADGWRDTGAPFVNIGPMIAGMVRDDGCLGQACSYHFMDVGTNPPEAFFGKGSMYYGVGDNPSIIGAFLYRESAIPTPSAISIFILALLCMMFSRRQWLGDYRPGSA